MSDKDFIERRQHRRVNVSIPVRYREVNSGGTVLSKKILQQSECVNISRGGMQLITQGGWEKHDDILIEAEFMLSGRNIRLIAHITWAKPDPGSEKFRTGFEFIAIKNGDLEVIGQIA